MHAFIGRDQGSAYGDDESAEGCWLDLARVKIISYFTIIIIMRRAILSSAILGVASFFAGKYIKDEEIRTAL